MSKRKILVVVSGSVEKEWDWIFSYFDSEKYQWDFCYLNTEKTRHMITRIFHIDKKIENYDIVISYGIGYCIAFAVALRLKVLGKKAAHVHHIAYSFVQTRRLFKTRFKFINNIINNIFNRCSVFITHSRIERKLLSEAHNLPIDKFQFNHWAFDLPEIIPTKFSERKKPYVCFIGRVNRDFKTFIEGIKGVDIDGVIITSSYNKLDIEDNNQIDLYNNLTFNECLDCIKNATANVILVNHGDSGAGHITMVLGMLMGKHQIISDVETVRDYFINGVHGKTIPVGDAPAFHNALMEISELTDAGSQSSLEYSHNWMTRERAAIDLEQVIENLMLGLKVLPYNPKWKHEYERLVLFNK